MWSHIYWYFEIRSNASYTAKLPIAVLIKTLEDTGVLQENSPHRFVNKEGFPWINVDCYYSTDGSFGRPDSYMDDFCTIISVVGSKNDPKNEQRYKHLLTDIAIRLNWELILESAGENGEDIVLRAITNI